MQPDFSKLFRRDAIAPLHFRVRSGACYVHDVEFLSSYLHDARLAPNSISKRGKKISLILERDCWEFGFTEHAKSSELHLAKSRLSITPVSAVRFEMDDPQISEQEIWIESIFVGASHWEKCGTTELVISAPRLNWKWCISIADDFADIRLDDLETPYLYSARTT